MMPKLHIKWQNQVCELHLHYKGIPDALKTLNWLHFKKIHKLQFIAMMVPSACPSFVMN